MKCSFSLENFDTVNDVLYFFCPEAPRLRQAIKVPGLNYKLPGGQKFSFKLSPLSVGFPQRRPLNTVRVKIITGSLVILEN